MHLTLHTFALTAEESTFINVLRDAGLHGTAVQEHDGINFQSSFTAHECTTYIYDMVVDRVKRKMHICFLFSDSFSFPSLE